MTPGYEVRNTEMSDLEQIFHLFEQSISYQEQKGYPVWRNYDREAITRDIENKEQYKVMMEGKMAIVFSVCYTDRIIWRHYDRGDSIYLHRIVVNPELKGKKLFGKILEWAKTHCVQKGLRYIRMDTWANNPTIIDYYKGFGFREIEEYITPDSVALPAHNRKLALKLLEYNTM
jgi:ribosomal protein S18 acetylase RimI-like enzyme